MQKLILFGGTGFIGSHLCDDLIMHNSYDVYLCSRTPPKEDFWLQQKHGRDQIKHVICDLRSQDQIAACLTTIKPEKVVYCVGENPTNTPKDSTRFIDGNIISSYNFLNNCKDYFGQLNAKAREQFKILNVSSYEIYEFDPPSTDLRIFPKTIYSASKAASLHLFEAWKNTYNLPVVSAICSNNYGMNQGSDKLIPLTINNIFKNHPIHLFQQGACQRNWVHVRDTSAALALILRAGKVGSVYNISSNALLSNKQLVNRVINSYVKLTGKSKEQVERLIVMVNSMEHSANSHDCQYNKLAEEFGWEPKVSIDSGLLETTQFYLQNQRI